MTKSYEEDTGRPSGSVRTSHGRAARARRRLPSNRAVLGAALVTVAAAGVLVAHRSATQPPSSRHVVATRAIAVGETIGADDLGTVAADLPDDVSTVDGSRAEDLVGRVAASALQPLDLVRPTDLLDDGRFLDPDAVEIALELPPARALHGTATPGSRVDVFRTDPDGSGTEVLATGIRVSEVDSGDGDGIGASGSVRVLLSVPGAELATRVVDASLRAEVTLALPRPGATS